MLEPIENRTLCVLNYLGGLRKSILKCITFFFYFVFAIYVAVSEGLNKKITIVKWF